MENRCVEGTPKIYWSTSPSIFLRSKDGSRRGLDVEFDFYGLFWILSFFFFRKIALIFLVFFFLKFTLAYFFEFGSPQYYSSKIKLVSWNLVIKTLWKISSVKASTILTYLKKLKYGTLLLDHSTLFSRLKHSTRFLLMTSYFSIADFDLTFLSV